MNMPEKDPVAAFDRQRKWSVLLGDKGSCQLLNENVLNQGHWSGPCLPLTTESLNTCQ